jgi:tetratricopeptide (TPR) repeat protein
MAELNASCLTEDSVLEYFDGQLSSEQLLAVETHIESCDRCRAWLSEAGRAVAADEGQRNVLSGVSLEPGATVAGRYRIIRFIAQGGMGEVYEAEDLELHERIALKTVGMIIADDVRAIDRLKREVQLARKVTHPNVCRIFDFGVYSEPGKRSTLGGHRMVFLTMELLEGESLAERLRRGRMTTDEALPLAQQMAEGLEAAHRVGVIHRDFKPHNVMLVPAQNGGVRAVVTDFGLARSGNLSASLSLSRSGELVGTPSYMAPEQVVGEDATSATDIYALGLVLYEMVTGELPFRAESPIATALMRREHRPSSPKRLVADLNPTWEKTILCCLKRDPRDRFSCAQDVALALSGIKVHRQRAWMKGVAAVVVLAFALGAAQLWSWKSGVTPSRQPRRSIAVLGFRDLSSKPETSWMSTAFAELLSTELAVGKRLRTTSGELVAQAKKDLGLPDVERFGKDTLTKINGQLGVDFVVAGSYLAVGQGADRRIRLDLSVQDARTAESVASLSETGSEGQLLEMVSQAGVRLRAALDGGDLTEGEERQARATQPSGTEAARLYAEALGKQRAYDLMAAKVLLEKSIAAEPSFALAHAALSDVNFALGHHARAREEAHRAFALSEGLPREERLLVEGRLRVVNQEWPKAIELYRALFTFFPDEVSYGLALTDAQIAGGMARDALRTLESLRALPSPQRDDARIDLREADACRRLGDLRCRLEAAQRAAQKGRASGARLLAADALRIIGQTQFFLGDMASAEQSIAESERLCVEIGDKRCQIDAEVATADLLFAQGDLTAAKAQYEKTAAFYHALGNERRVADQQNVLGQVLFAQGKPTEAILAYKKALEIYKMVDNLEGVGNVSNNWADILVSEGNLKEARQKYEEALALFRQLENKVNAAVVLGNISSLLRQEGHLAEAKAANDSALSDLREVGDKDKSLDRLIEAGQQFREGSDFAQARGAYNEALSIAQAESSAIYQRQIEIYLAQLELDEGRFAEAEEKSRATMKALEEMREEDGLLMVLPVLSRALLAQGKVDDASSTSREALRFAAKTRRPDFRMNAELLAAEVEAAQGNCREAGQQVTRLMGEPRLQVLVDMQMEAALRLGQMEVKCGQRRQGLDRLSKVAKRAREGGFARIAQKASAQLSF